jgi:hypothetical protein
MSIVASHRRQSCCISTYTNTIHTHRDTHMTLTLTHRHTSAFTVPTAGCLTLMLHAQIHSHSCTHALTYTYTYTRIHVHVTCTLTHQHRSTLLSYRRQGFFILWVRAFPTSLDPFSKMSWTCLWVGVWRYLFF